MKSITVIRSLNPEKKFHLHNFWIVITITMCLVLKLDRRLKISKKYKKHINCSIMKFQTEVKSYLRWKKTIARRKKKRIQKPDSHHLDNCCA